MLIPKHQVIHYDHRYQSIDKHGERSQDMYYEFQLHIIPIAFWPVTLWVCLHVVFSAKVLLAAEKNYSRLMLIPKQQVIHYDHRYQSIDQGGERSQDM
jgi:hypothetical protein